MAQERSDARPVLLTADSPALQGLGPHMVVFPPPEDAE